MSAYSAQHRGSDSDYRRYFEAMDASMRLKLAAIGAHFLLDPGARVADMGCGSGSGTFQFALLNPQIRVIGVDINPETVRLASEAHRLPNLEFRIGDASKPCFAGERVDGVLTSSTLHHVHTFSGYDPDMVRQALAAHLDDLNDDGMLVVRDFVLPPDPWAPVLLSLRAGDDGDGTPLQLSDASLLLLFARTARPLDKREGPGFMVDEIAPDRPGWRRFRLAARHAVEFMLRKDYRAYWDTEILEEYCYFTLDEMVGALRQIGARVLHAAPFVNPWIATHRFEGRVRLTDQAGRPLPWPATNMLVAAQKAPRGAPVRFLEKRPSAAAPSYLKTSSWRHTGTGQVMDLVARPGGVVDVLPWRLDEEGRLRVVARQGYPRPVTAAMPRGADRLDGAVDSGHQIEPIALALPGEPAEAEILRLAAARAGLTETEIVAAEAGLGYLPSAGGIAEMVASRWLRVEDAHQATPIPAAATGFTRSGHLREFDAQNLLRAAQTGMLSEARLETNIRALLRRIGQPADPWIADTIRVGWAEPPVASFATLLAEDGCPFAPSDTSAGYLRHLRSEFAEQTVESGLPRTLASQEYEFVVPARMSANTISVLPVVRRPSDGAVLIGVERRDLPAAQLLCGNAVTIGVPAFRLPAEVASLGDARRFAAEALRCSELALTPLGAAYRPSLGVTPETVYPYTVAEANLNPDWEIAFVPLAEVVASAARVRDGHLLVSALRLSDALGL